METLDLKGLKCPLPVLKTRKAMQSLEQGERLAVATTDPLATIDIPAYCQECGHTLLEETPSDEGHIFVIEKGS